MNLTFYIITTILCLFPVIWGLIIFEEPLTFPTILSPLIIIFTPILNAIAAVVLPLILIHCQRSPFPFYRTNKLGKYFSTQNHNTLFNFIAITYSILAVITLLIVYLDK